MISQIANLSAWVVLIVIVLIKFVQLEGVLPFRDLITRLILWGLGTFILMRLIGKILDGILNLSGKEGVLRRAPFDYTMGAVTPDAAILDEGTRKVVENEAEGAKGERVS